MENQEQLLLTLNNIALEIESRLDKKRLDAREQWDHSSGNWASDLHHPCTKFLVHARRDWQSRPMMDLRGCYRTEEGYDKESKFRDMLSRIQIDIDGTQRKYNTKTLEGLVNLKLGMKIDGVFDLKKFGWQFPPPFENVREIPWENKSVAPHYWDSTKTIEDLKRHPKFWINKIPSQFNSCLLFENWPGGLISLMTFGKKPRILPMLFDKELWEHDMGQLEKVNKHIDDGTFPPPIPYDPDVCGLCDFDHICQPLTAKGNLIEITEGETPELELYCDLQEQIKELKKKFDPLNAKLVGNKEKPGRYFGKEGMFDEYEITTSIQNRKRIQEDKKAELKKLTELFQEPYNLTTTKIKRMVKK